MALEITLRSGATVVADPASWKYTKKRDGNVSLSWTNRERGGRHLIHLDMDQVVAIVEISDSKHVGPPRPPGRA